MQKGTFNFYHQRCRLIFYCYNNVTPSGFVVMVLFIAIIISSLRDCSFYAAYLSGSCTFTTKGASLFYFAIIILSLHDCSFHTAYSSGLFTFFNLKGCYYFTLLLYNTIPPDCSFMPSGLSFLTPKVWHYYRNC